MNAEGAGADAAGQAPDKGPAQGEKTGETAGGGGRMNRARLARIFGDVLPETTRDERGPGEERPDSDEWLRGQVPPHHGTV